MCKIVAYNYIKSLHATTLKRNKFHSIQESNFNITIESTQHCNNLIKFTVIYEALYTVMMTFSLTCKTKQNLHGLRNNSHSHC